MLEFIAYASSSQGNLYEVRTRRTRLLIEAGLPWSAMVRLVGHRMSEFDACLISHKHGDHCHPQSVAQLHRAGVEVWHGERFASAHRALVLGKNEPIEVKAFEVRHDVPNHGFLLRDREGGQSCVFLIDTFYSPIRPLFSPTIVAIECNFAEELLGESSAYLRERLPTSHMSLKQCLETLLSWDLSATREIHLLHMSAERGDAELFERTIMEATGIPTYVAPARRARRD